MYAVDFVDAWHGWAVGRYGVIFHTTNGGNDWSPQTSGIAPIPLHALKFVDQNHGWAGGLEGVMIHTTDGGATWTQQVTGTTIRFAGIDFVDINNGWAVGIYGEIFHTTDGGTTWVPQNSGTGELLHAVDFIDLNNGWVTGRSGTILRTTDGGNTWTPQLTRTWYDVSAVCFINANLGWVSGDYGLIMATQDGGGIVSISPQNALLPDEFHLSQNYPNPFNPRTKITYRLASGSRVQLTVFDVSGRKVRELVKKFQPAGKYLVEFDGSPLASGIYFYRLMVQPAGAGKTESFTEIKKMVLVR